MINNRRPSVVLRVFALFIALAGVAFAQDGPLRNEEPNGTTPEEIIQRFAAKEKEFKQAREQYTWRQTVKVQTLDGETVDGEYHMVADILFDSRGRRTTNVVFAPQSTLQRIQMTPQDISDIENLLPFVLTSDEIDQYNILYAGMQQIDEIGTYVFDVAPKQIVKGQRYFQGRIWVDDRDFQIVRTQGQTVPQIREKNQENLFPKFTTWREQVDGRYWFPTYTRADDTLKFRNGDIKIREIVKYTNYKRFGSTSKITFEGEEVERAPQQGQQQGTQQKKP